MSMSRNWSSFRQSTKGTSSYVRKTAEVRTNPPTQEVIAAYTYSLKQAQLRGDVEDCIKYSAKLQALQH